jgi:hypothetical protein
MKVHTSGSLDLPLAIPQRLSAFFFLLVFGYTPQSLLKHASFGGFARAAPPVFLPTQMVLVLRSSLALSLLAIR